MVMTVPIPPFPESGGGGALVDIGYLEIGSGEFQPMSEIVSPNPNVEESVSASTDQEEEIKTQDLEEAPEIKITEKKKVDPKKKEVKVEVEQKKVVPVVPERKSDPRAIYQGKNNNSTSQGSGTNEKGDQGKADGDLNGKGTGGNGTGGDGIGSGNGSGSGSGSGAGPGRGAFNYSLGNRKIMSKPSITDRSQETGTVVVEITVDKFGKIIKANPGARGTTTSSSHLWNIAKQAAYTASFNASPEAAEEQKGTITFVFSME